MPSSQLQAAQQVWGQGYMPANPSVPLILGDHGGSWRDGTQATRGLRRHQETRQGATSLGVTCPGTEPTWRKALALLLETHPQASGPHRATSTARKAVSCCVWGMRELYGMFMT